MLSPVRTVVLQSLGTEAKQYLARMKLAGGSISGRHLRAVDTFVKAAKRNGYWEKLLEVGPIAGNTLTSSLQKLKYIKTSALVNNGFTNSDYSNIGIHGGSGKWMSLATNWSDINKGGLGGLIFFASNNAPQNASYQFLLGTSFGDGLQFGIRFNTDSTLQMTIGGTVDITKSKVNDAYLRSGVLHAERSSLSLFRTYSNGCINGEVTTTVGTTELSVDIALMAQRDGGLPCLDIACGFYAISDGTFSDANAAQIALDIQDLMYDLGRYSKTLPVYNYIPFIGQSLACAGSHPSAITTTQPYSNMMFSTGQLGGNPANPASVVWTTSDYVDIGTLSPLREITYETPATAFANLVSSLARANGLGSSYDSVIGNWAVGGTAYSGLSQGTNPYNNSVAAIDKMRQHRSLYSHGGVRVPAIICVHGESDANSGTYQSDINAWQANYTADIGPKTGQSNIPIFHSQPSSWTSPNNINSATAASPYAILSEHETNPTKTILVCPKYFLPHAGDGVHLTGAGYQRMAEYYAKAYFQHVVQGIQWEPLRPSSITRSGANIDVVFTGIAGSLTLDNSSVSDPSLVNNTYGFEYTDSVLTDKYTSISSVSILNATTVRITLILDPTGNSSKTLRYAYTGIAGNSGGPTTGPRGCLRDSDSTASLHGHALYNWCVHFSKTIT